MNKFVKEVIPEIRQILKTQEDDAVRAKFNPEELKKALIDPNLTTQEKVNLVERAKERIKQNIDTKAIIDASPQSGRDTTIIGRKNLNADIIQYAQENKKVVAVDNVDPDLAKNLGFKYPNETRRTIYADEITHTLKNHGNEAAEAKRGQIAITRDDIANYIDYVENPDRQILSQTKQGLKALISGKQKDGYYVVVEEAQTKNNRLAFKTMYKVKGDIKESSLFKATADAENGERLAFSGYKPDAQRIPSLNDPIIPQSSQKVKELPPADLRKAIINAKDDKERLVIIENQKAGIKQRLENEAAGDKTADKLAKEAQGLADNKPAEKKFTLETIKSFDPRKNGHAYLSKISFNDRKPVREFIDSNTRMWDSKRKYYETSYTFNAKEGDMFEARLDDGSWKSDTKEYYIVKKDDKGELYLSKAKELSDLQKEAIKEAEVKSEWESKISSSTDAVKLNKIMRDIKHTEAITPNNRAKLYVAITNRLKELRKTER